MFDETWGMIQGCMSYGFCSTHAAATSLDMCYGAYLKVHYPYEYYTVCFNEYSNDLPHIERLTKELEYFNIELREIKFGRSGGGYRFSKKEKCIYKGLSSIKFISNDVAEELLTLSQNTYPNFVSLLSDIKSKTSADSRQIEILITLDFFSAFGKNRKLLKIYELFKNIYSRKQFKKAELDKLGIEEVLLKKYAATETEKMYKDVDTLALINELSFQIPNKTLTLKRQISSEKEYLGYVQYTNEKIENNIYCVTEYKTYKDARKPYITIYNCHSGESVKTKVKDGRIYERQPFGLWSILRIDSFDQEFKRKLINDKWTETDELEPILNNYEVLVQ